MKVLQLSYRCPWPLKDGGAIGIFNLMKAYQQCGHQVTLVFFNTTKHPVEEAVWKQALSPFAQAIAVPLANEINAFGAIKALLTNKSYHISRFESEQMQLTLQTLLSQQQFDLIHVDGVFMGPYITLLKHYSAAKIILRTHNVEFLIWQRVAANAAFLKKWYLKLLTRQLKAYELQCWNKADELAVISAPEATLIQQLGCTTPIRLLPAGIDLSAYAMKSHTVASSFFHIGSMEWAPNQEAMDWFLKKVWPNFYEAHPESRLALAGRAIAAQHFERCAGVEVHGEVENAISFMQQAGIMIVPLLSGGGVRIKIIEAMALGKCIISTTIGAEGIPYTNGVHLLLADSASDFFEQMNFCLANPHIVQAIGQAARELAEQQFQQCTLLQNWLDVVQVPGQN